MTINRNKTKLKIRKQISILDQTNLTGPIQKVIDWVTTLEKEYSDKGYSNMELNLEGSYEDYPDLVLYGYIEETDKEYNNRMKRIEKEKRREKEFADQHKERIRAEAKRLGII